MAPAGKWPQRHHVDSIDRPEARSDARTLHCESARAVSAGAAADDAARWRRCWKEWWTRWSRS